MKDYPPEYDNEDPDNRYFAEAFPDADSPAELYRQVYKYTDCGAYLSMTIEYVEVSGTCFDDYHEKMVQKTLHCDELRHLGTWKEMDQQGMLATSLLVGSIVEGCDYGTDNIEVVANQVEEDPSDYRTRFDAALSKVEQEAQSIWNDTHGCESCAAHWVGEGIDLDGEMSPIWIECPDCQGQGQIM